MSRRKELRECPFCGGKTIATVRTNSNNTHVGFEFKIRCNDCDVEYPKLYNVSLRLDENMNIEIIEDMREEALSDWNNRVSSY